MTDSLFLFLSLHMYRSLVLHESTHTLSTREDSHFGQEFCRQCAGPRSAIGRAPDS